MIVERCSRHLDHGQGRGGDCGAGGRGRPAGDRKHSLNLASSLTFSLIQRQRSSDMVELGDRDSTQSKHGATSARENVPAAGRLRCRLIVAKGNSSGACGLVPRHTWARPAYACSYLGPVTGILVRRGFWSGTKIPRMRPDKTVRPGDFGPGAEVFV